MVAIQDNKKSQSKKNKQKTLVLLDAHAILHRAFHALPFFTSSDDEPTGALYGLTAMLIKVIRDLDPDYIMACYDLPEPTFRHVAYKEYKGKRAKTDDELISQIDKSRDILVAFHIPVYDAPGFEADDVIGTITDKVTKLIIHNSKLQVIIASGDVDTFQLIKGKDVIVYTLKKGIQDTIIYDEEKMKERFGFVPALLADFKGLKGDPSDNIIGVPGIGNKNATDLIQKFGAIENIYKVLKKNEQKFLDAGFKRRIIDLLKKHEEDAYFSKELATIRKDVPIDFSLEDGAWRNAYNKKEAENFLEKFGFKSLISRLPDDVGRRMSYKTKVSEAPLLKTSKEEEKKNIWFDPQTVKRLSVAVWLADSKRIKISMEEILDLTGAKSIEQAEKNLMKKLSKEKLKDFFEDVEVPLMDILERMKKTGIMIDVAVLEKFSQKNKKEISKLEKQIWKLSGEEFNIASPKQLSEIIYTKMRIGSSVRVKRTGTGALSTGESTLKKLEGASPIIALILQFRELSKLQNTYVNALLNLVDNKSRIYTTFNQAGTVTGRFSSQNPNLQNIPIKTKLGREVRQAFVAPKGWKLLAVDYSQIELRIAAILSKDKLMTKTFLEGGDIHTTTAEAVFNVTSQSVTPEMRRKAKVINFGILYGMGARALSQNLNVSLEEAGTFIEEYFNDFAGVRDYVEKTKKEVLNKGFVKTLFNRKRHFPELRRNLPEYLQKEFLRMAVNAPLQGSAADIMKMAMVRVDKALQKEKNLRSKVNMILQIHDELLFEVEDDSLSVATKIIKKEMEDVYKNKIPLSVDISVGQNWKDMNKL